MKKTKRPSTANPIVKPQASPVLAAPRFRWWPWAAALAGLIAVCEVYTPALNGAFVFDDRSLPFFDPRVSPNISGWVGLLRPLLMLSFWANYRLIGAENPAAHPYAFHATNVLIHFCVAVVAALISAKLLEWAGVVGRMRAALSIFSGALFLLHPLQTESVAYVASRSEDLSTLFYYGAFALFVWRRSESITLLRSVVIMALFVAGIGTKEHVLTLPALFLLTDFYWGRGGIRKNAILYGLFAIGAAVGARYVFFVLGTTPTAGFRVSAFTPAQYFFTQCRVIWIYIRMFFLPFGQNIDPDIAISKTVFDQGAILGLLGLLALVAGAIFYRRRFPLAGFGILMFLLLLSPTSSVVPIRDVLAEHRLYLPFLGLTLVCVEFLRRMNYTSAVWTGVAALAFCSVLTYKRNQVWENPLALWQDSVSKAPEKYRPRFQLAYAQFDARRCQQAADSYQVASRLGPVDDTLLVDWGLALGCAGHWEDALGKMKQALQFKNSAHIHTQVAVAYASLRQFDNALNELADAERVDPHYDQTYVYRGQVYSVQGDSAAAAREFRRALEINPDNQTAREGLRLSVH